MCDRLCQWPPPFETACPEPRGRIERKVMAKDLVNVRKDSVVRKDAKQIVDLVPALNSTEDLLRLLPKLESSLAGAGSFASRVRANLTRGSGQALRGGDEPFGGEG
jgi:hypothetical protein